MCEDSKNSNDSIITSKVISCCVKIVVKNYAKYKDFETDSKVKSCLSECCKNLLIHSVLRDKANLDLSNNKLAKVYGITHVIVQKTNIQNNSTTGLVTISTKFSVQSVHSHDFYKFSQEASRVRKLGGLSKELEKVLQVIHLNRMKTDLHHRPLGITIHGPPGCGKTSFVQTVSVESSSVLFAVDSFALLKSEAGVGQNALQNVFQKAADLTVEGPVILFFDEIDTLCPRPENASMGNKQLSSTLMSAMDNLQRRNIPGLFVMATTNAISSIDPLLRRPGRFDKEVLINVPNQQQRISILEALTSGLQLASDVDCVHLAQKTPGFVGADLQQLCEEAVNQALSNLNNQSGNVILQPSDFESALHKVIPSMKKSSDCVVDLQPVKWNEIGGLEDVKSEIKQSVEWPLLFPEALAEMDICPPRGLLLYGPPGCCKTTLVRAAATSTNISFLSLSGAQTYSPFVGESERIISEAFHKARALAPSILFLDEIESIVGKRRSGSGQSRVQERILSTLLNEMDGVGTRLDHNIHRSSSATQAGENQKTLYPTSESATERGEEMSERSTSSMGVMLVGATNRPDMLDAAILRPGRLDRHIFVPPPDQQARKAILKIYTNKMPSHEDVDLDTLSEQTDFYTGADLKNLCKEAGLTALREASLGGEMTSDLKVTQTHFMEALKTVKASLSKEILQQYRK